MNQPDRKDFFISFNKADKAWAEWIAWELEDRGYSCVLQAWDFRPGRNFVLEMDKAAKLARRTLAVLSPDYLTSQFTALEWAATFKQDRAAAGSLLVPVRVRPCRPEGLLGSIIYIDLVELNEQRARKVLIAGLEEMRAKPSSPPRYPCKGPPREAPRFPGALPPIWNVPYPRNPNFTGRAQLLEDLRTSFMEGKTAALTQAALHGLGGVGKTQLALEYAYRHGPDYDLVWWVRAEDPVALASEYAALAGPLDLPEKGAAEQEVAVAAVRQWLSQNCNWLVIFDNAGEPHDLKAYIPQGGGGHILITSRNPVWREVARPLDVKVWHRGESVAFLLKRTGHWDEAAAAELAQEVGDLPLALEQAGAYINESGCSIAHYLNQFRYRRRELLKRGKPSQDYPDTVASLWEFSFHRIKEESPTTANLLNLFAFLAPDDIPAELLKQGAAHLPKPLFWVVQDPVQFNDALARLRRYSLLDVSNDALTVHRLVQSVARDRLDKKSKKQWAGAAVEMVNAAFPGDIQINVDTWSWCARLLPHALAAAGHAQNLGIAPDAAGRLMNQAGLYLRARAEFGEARRAFEAALAINEAAFGPSHPQVAIRVNNLGRVLQDLGDLAGARALFERALAIDETAYGPNNPEVATGLNNLGRVLRDMGDLKGAKACFERALAIDEAAYGPNNPEVATGLNNLGIVLRDLGDLNGAKALFEHALAIWERVFGPNHPQVATAVNNLGGVLQDLGDLPGARAYYERALAIDEAVYGPSHPQVAMIVNNLGLVMEDQGDLPGARVHFERALAIDEATYGRNHPNVAKRLNNLGMIFQKFGDFHQALFNYEKALEIISLFLWKDHPLTIQVQKNIKNLHKLTGGLK